LADAAGISQRRTTERKTSEELDRQSDRQYHKLTLFGALWLSQERATWSKIVFWPERFLTKGHEEEEEEEEEDDDDDDDDDDDEEASYLRYC